MAKDRLLDTRSINFSDLIRNGKRYKVPSFQRNYAWSIENWEDLWLDILKSYETQTPHFMGTIVTQTVQASRTIDGSPPALGEQQFAGPSDIKIIDGQQRFATLSIVAIAIIHQLQTLVDNSIEADANRERQAILRRTYLGDRNPSSLRYSSKLSLNETDDGFYQDNLINLRAPRNVYALTQSQRLLWQSFEYFSQQLEARSDISQDGTLLASFLDALALNLTFIQISVEDETNAYVLFETLNSRGVELGATDLLKNYVFSLLRGPDDHNAARREWQGIVRTVGMAEVPELLRNFLSMTHPYVSRQRLFKLTRERVYDAKQAFELLSQLGDYGDFYVALGRPLDDFWKSYSESRSVRAHIQDLNVLGARAIYSALFSAYTKFDEKNFLKLLKLLNIVYFRYSTVSKLNLNTLEKACNQLAIAIFKGDVQTPRESFNHLNSFYVSDDKFQQDFALLTLPHNQDKRIVKYILKRLEETLTKKGIDEDQFSIEHILPRSPSRSWQQAFDPNDTQNFIYRLGNLTPLETSLNRRIGSEDYLTKQKAYSKSVYQLTQTIQSEEWTANSIAARQTRMAKQASQIWTIDY
ncbi:MAG: DUF262 domain-containing HNH endonuclease family protein [Cyanobacteria bacterium J06597_16]